MGNRDKVYSNIINKFSVRILYKHPELSNTNIGSGVLVKVDGNTCYLITAKHNFKLKENDNYWNVDINILNINLDKITISNDNNTKVCVVNKLLYYSDKYDLLVFSLIDWSKDIQELSLILIDKNLNLKEMNCYFYGYPDSIGTPSGMLSYEGHLNKEDEKHIFRLDRTKSVKSDALNGFSGSGIFVEIKNSYYLVGIFTEFGDDHNFYYGIDLNFILNEINRKLDIPILGNQEIYKFIEEYDIYINKNLTTFREYSIFCKDEGKKEPKPYFQEEDNKNFPVVNVSWNDAKAYCDWLNKKDDKFYYRLPTVKEWETIAKKNMPDKNYDEYIWHKSNTTQINDIATKKAGKLGIYDMYGNVHEWCEDPDKEQPNKKIAKGGSFKFSLEYLLNIQESISFLKKKNNVNDLSFRIIKEKSKEPKPKHHSYEEEIIVKKMKSDLSTNLEKISSDFEFYNKIIPNHIKKFKILKSCIESYLKTSESAKK